MKNLINFCLHITAQEITNNSPSSGDDTSSLESPHPTHLRKYDTKSTPPTRCKPDICSLWNRLTLKLQWNPSCKCITLKAQYTVQNNSPPSLIFHASICVQIQVLSARADPEETDTGHLQPLQRRWKITQAKALENTADLSASLRILSAYTFSTPFHKSNSLHFVIFPCSQYSFPWAIYLTLQNLKLLQLTRRQMDKHLAPVLHRMPDVPYSSSTSHQRDNTTWSDFQHESLAVLISNSSSLHL